MKTHVLVSIEHKKPIADLSDIIAGRIYTMDNVEKNGECSARILTEHEVMCLEPDIMPTMDNVPAILRKQAA